MDTTKEPFLSDKAYNYIKHIVQVILPALGTFYVTLAQIWGLPAPEAVAGTILALSTLLGITLRINLNRYEPYSGDIMVTGSDEDGQPLLYLNLNEIPEDFVNNDEVLMRIKKLS
ncbi:hypothetical protein KC887_02270 [Candidatus Kaiserbacteria bacterium]|nr:hypothetical protein [Candidatus Kaiserbacteria bacterium]